MLDFITKIRRTLSPRMKWSAVLLISLFVLNACFELLGLSLVLPVVSAFAAPELLENNRYLARLYAIVNPESRESFILIMATVLVIFYCFKNLFGYLLLQRQTAFLANLDIDFACRLFRNYMNAPYSFHVRSGAAELVNRIQLSNSLTNTVLQPLLLLVAEAIVSGFMILTIYVIAPIPMLVVNVLALAVFFGYYRLKQRSYSGLSETLLESESENFKLLQDSLSGIREVKISGAGTFFEQKLRNVRSRRNYAQKAVFDTGNAPRFLLETISVFLAMALIIVMVLMKQPLSGIVIFATLFVVAMFRLLPSFSRIHYALSQIRTGQGLFDRIYGDLTTIEQEPRPHPGSGSKPKEIPFDRDIRLEDVTFGYEPDKPVLKHFSAEIKKLECVAIVGPTGCGKTTLVDLILGFYLPESGAVLSDGVPIRANLPSWRKRVGYVAQNFAFLDDTLRANIAFGVPEDRIDDDRIRETLRLAQLDSFVATLPEGIRTRTGESALKLSGGQRQRLAIARALYHDPEILILDEATSALDNETEKAFVDALHSLHGKLTILMIAHRLSSLEHCDRSIRLEQRG